MASPSLKQRGIPAAAVVLIVLAALSGSPSAAGASPDAAAARYAWAWPVEGPRQILRPYIAPETPYAAGHRGIDIAAAPAAAVRSPADGVIHFSGFVVDRYVVSIDHGAGLISSFEPVLSPLADGTVVHRGETIGALQSGHCRAPCLHVGARLHGQYVSPLNYLGGIAHSVLLPTRELP